MSDLCSQIVMFLWTVALLLMGIYDIVLFPGILRALDLSRAVMCKPMRPAMLVLLAYQLLHFIRVRSYGKL